MQFIPTAPDPVEVHSWLTSGDMTASRLAVALALCPARVWPGGPLNYVELSQAIDAQIRMTPLPGVDEDRFPSPARRDPRPWDSEADATKAKRGRSRVTVWTNSNEVTRSLPKAKPSAIAGGTLESGFSQSDVATWAQTGTGIWEDREAVSNLVAIANLYPETIHLVASADSGISGVADLAGMTVSMDEPGSGTLVDARIILGAYGLSEEDVDAQYLKPDQAAERMRDGAMDAFFFVGGFPAGAIAELASQDDIVLVPITGPEAEAIRADYTFFAENIVPGGTYEGVDEDTTTLSVGAQWITSADQPEELIYQITAALWNDSTRTLLDAGHQKGREITVETATDGVGIPFHPGAERFYRELGLVE